MPVTSLAYLEAVKHRRTIYGVTDTISVSDERIIQIVNEVIQTCPSSWNMQSTRILVTLGKEHKRLWSAIIDAAKPNFPSEEDWKRNEERFKSFRDGYGTISVFEDHTAIEKLHSRFPSHPISVFETFAEHSSAMHQITLWTAIELEEGLGASLQHTHFVPGVEDGIRAAFDIPSTWSAKAELVFGGLVGEWPVRPEKEAVSTTVRVYK